MSVSYTHLRAHETREDLVCRLLLEKKRTGYTRFWLLPFFFPSLFDALFIRKKPTTINFDFSTQVPLTLSPVTGRRLDYTIFSGDIGVTD